MTWIKRGVKGLGKHQGEGLISRALRLEKQSQAGELLRACFLEPSPSLGVQRVIRFFSLTSLSRDELTSETRFADEMARQMAWLAQQGRAKGYQDVRELARKDHAEFVRLAAEWRAHHAGRGIPPLRGRLCAQVRRGVRRLSRALGKRE